MNARDRDATLLIDRETVRAHLPLVDVLATVEQVFAAHGRGEVVMPEKLTLDLRPAGIDAHNHAMPAYVPSLRAAGLKWVRGYPKNPVERDLPYIQATILLQEPETGRLLAVLDGTEITNLRTGAAAAIFARLLARPDSSVLAIVGAGKQGGNAARAIAEIFSLRTLSLYDVVRSASQRLAEEAGAWFEADIRVAESVEEAVRGADIVVTTTSADEPLVQEAWLKPGSTAISVGSYQEFDDQAVLQMDKIIVDSWAQCVHRGELRRLAEAGLLTRDRIAAEIGEVAIGRRPGRESEQQRILGVPIGLGTLDVAVARLVYDRVRAAGAGTPFDFG